MSAAEDAGKAVEIDSSNAKAQLRKGCDPIQHARVCIGCIHATATSMQLLLHANVHRSHTLSDQRPLCAGWPVSIWRSMRLPSRRLMQQQRWSPRTSRTKAG